MGDFPLIGDGQRYLSPTSLAASRGTTVTPNASANTKGSYATLSSAANNVQHSSGILLHIAIGIGVETDYLVDLAIGAAGSEVVIAENLLVCGASSSGYRVAVYAFHLPVQIPAGVRIAARCQALGASSGALHVNCSLLAQGLLPSSPLSRVTTYGADTSDSGGVSVDPGGSANTKGAWSQLAASTRPAGLLVVAFGNQANIARSAGNFMVDIGVGAAGAEVVVIPNLALKASASGAGVTIALEPLVFPPLPVAVPAGARLAARAQSNNTDATDRLLDVVCYGID